MRRRLYRSYGGLVNLIGLSYLPFLLGDAVDLVIDAFQTIEYHA